MSTAASARPASGSPITPRNVDDGKAKPAKLILGLPLFGLGAWATWWGLRRYSSPSDDSSDAGEATI